MFEVVGEQDYYPKSTKTRIETHLQVVNNYKFYAIITPNPLKQGLKPQKSTDDLFTINLIITPNPLKQGLKPLSMHNVRPGSPELLPQIH